MGRVVAVEAGLTPVARLLSKRGYEVVDLDRSHLERADLVLVSGMDEDFMGVEAAVSPAPVLTVAGRTPEQVLDEVERRLGPGARG